MAADIVSALLQMSTLLLYGLFLAFHATGIAATARPGNDVLRITVLGLTTVHTVLWAAVTKRTPFNGGPRATFVAVLAMSVVIVADVLLFWHCSNPYPDHDDGPARRLRLSALALQAASLIVVAGLIARRIDLVGAARRLLQRARG